VLEVGPGGVGGLVGWGGMPIRLSERRPEVGPDRLLSECVPPPRFAPVRFETYRPDPTNRARPRPSQYWSTAVLRSPSPAGRPLVEAKDRPHDEPGSTSTADSVSARPTCSRPLACVGWSEDVLHLRRTDEPVGALGCDQP